MSIPIAYFCQLDYGRDKIVEEILRKIIFLTNITISGNNCKFFFKNCIHEKTSIINVFTDQLAEYNIFNFSWKPWVFNFNTAIFTYRVALDQLFIVI